ncbi:MAG: hypothetical protein IT497_00060 [Ottowia sp.]|nr:hypothetical protein [Ottowia sp.]
MVKSESHVLGECLDWLAIHGFFAWRNNTGCLKAEDRFVKFGQPGSADIIGLTKQGRFLAIECKNGGTNARQRKKQEIFQMQVEKNGGIYILARDVKDIMKLLDDTL